MLFSRTMLYAFDGFELDTGKVELRHGPAVVPLEPQVYALLLLLVENRERIVSRDEIVEKVWDGRIVSDSAITSRLKSARKALGDDGKSQRFIRTVHGHGVRFIAKTGVVAPVAAASDSSAAQSENEPARILGGRPSIAVLPFRLLGQTGAHAAMAEAIPHDLIVAMARLRWLFVIARGSSFRFRSSNHDATQVGALLNVRYCLSGVVEIFGTSLSVTVELTDTRSGGILWGERFEASVDGVHEIRARIITQVVGALEIQIPLNEAHLARLSAPENLDAWSAYHLGLQHMYRFNRKDNEAASRFFEQAIAREPTFARAHAGLSFTHFQSAFMRYASDPAQDIANTRHHAERSIELDPLDPFANFTMGRSFWLTGDLDGSRSWLERSTELSPNFAQGYYARAWTDAVSEHRAGNADPLDMALALSPLDPFRFAMLATRAMSCLGLGDISAAADWADKAARTPGAHVLIGMIAVVAQAMNGNTGLADFWAAEVRNRRSEIGREHFFHAFPFREGPLRQEIMRVLVRHRF